jgi:hypothetical protein|uniref:Uncharacterized protein n=1 Tax=Caudovirales sp. ct2KA10 TaxID=2825757 RepID=A0A8S5U4J3_9CAUD|nr:MAG TPA: hypothetical protein [Caudovirales sp. ct2KA10]
MKFEDAKVGMEVVVTGEQADRFPEGAVIVDIDKNDFSVRLKGAYGVHLWFWDINSREPKEQRNAYDMSDIHLKDGGFRKLPPTTHLLAEYLGLDPEKVKCYVDKENSIIKVKQGDVEAKAKKAPQDKWDFRLGMGLALCRLTEKLAEHRKPAFKEPCHYVLKDGIINFTTIGLFEDFIQDSVMYAMGNVFKTRNEAEDNTEEMLKRANMIIEFCKKQGW